MDFLHDEKFLRALDRTRNKEIFARITALTFDERPIEYIEGRITNSGSISVDGNSAIRRTCSLSMVATQVDINQYNWGLNHKFKLEVGLANTIDSRYPPICWFKQGLYVITGFTCNVSNNNYAISINGKDKGCLLNGEVSGNLPSSVDFGCIESYENFYEQVELTADTYLPNKYYTKKYDVDQYIKFAKIIVGLDGGTAENFYNYDADAIVADWAAAIEKLKSYYTYVFNYVSSVGPITEAEDGTAINNKLVVALYRFCYEPQESDEYILCEDEEFSPNKIYYAKGSTLYKEKLPIKTIIREAVHTYAGEPYSNIIINDLDDYGMELMEYRGDEDHPLYLTHRVNTEVYAQAIFNGNTPCYKINKDSSDLEQDPDGLMYTGTPDENKRTTFANLEYDSFTSELVEQEGTYIIPILPISGDTRYPVYTVAKITYGMTPGYRITNLVYAGELIANIGETLSSVLDKIKNMLTAFEYFYDLDGRFVFQKKRLFTMTSWNNIVDNKEGQKYVEPAKMVSPYFYTFEDSMIVSAFNNSPNLNNLKNDYSVWGKRKTATGAEVPVHMRLAFDRKPRYYKSLNISLEQAQALKAKYPSIFQAKAEKYVQVGTRYDTNDWDWREIIYQMAMDSYKYGTMEDFGVRLAEANGPLWTDYYPDEAAANPYLYFKTGYEQYYVDMEGFWRTLYNPSPVGEEKEQFYPATADAQHRYWNKNVFEAPEMLNFWINFHDEGEIAAQVISKVGDRPKVVNDSNVKAIYYRDTPTLIFITHDEYQKNFNVLNTGYRYVYLTPNMEGLFTISAQGKSAKDTIDDLLYTNSYYVESASVTTFPVYYLEPNVYIYIKDKQSGIDGAYSISQFSIPLTYNGTMSFTAVKAVDRII